MFKFITTKPLWVNVLVAISLVALLLFCVLQLLGSITNHGKYLSVPSVVGKKTSDAIKFLEDKGFDVVIQDSIYTDTAKMGIVLKQLPDPNSTVKINRTVQITVNRLTLPLIDMPSLEGKTFNFALQILKRSHLILGDTTFRPDFMKGSVLDQLFKGQHIDAGTKLPWGTAVDLVIGDGLKSEKMLVPNLVGLTYGEAKTLLEASGILVGAIIPDQGTKDTLAAFIWKQSPPRFDDQKEPVYIQSGQLMDLWVAPEMKVPRDTTIL